MHAGAREACAGDGAASSLHHAGADLQTLRAEIGIAHALTIGFHVLEGRGSFSAVVCKGAQSGQQPVQVLALEFRTAGLGPGFAAVPVAREQSPRDVPRLLGSLEEGDDLNGSGERLRCARQIRFAPSPRTTGRVASGKPRRSASRRMRCVKAGGSASVSREAAPSMAANWVAEHSS